jgi:hypothetical protein
MDLGTIIWNTIALFLTCLCISSLLYKDNPFYKFAEHAVIGVSCLRIILGIERGIFESRLVVRR